MSTGPSPASAGDRVGQTEPAPTRLRSYEVRRPDHNFVRSISLLAEISGQADASIVPFERCEHAILELNVSKETVAGRFRGVAEEQAKSMAVVCSRWNSIRHPA